MGLPVFQEFRRYQPMSGLEVMARSGEANHVQIQHACGNSMVQIAIGAVCAFALGTSAHRNEGGIASAPVAPAFEEDSGESDPEI